MNREELLNVAKPILFNTDMVRAIQDNRKTVTRRVVTVKGRKPPYYGGIQVNKDSIIQRAVEKVTRSWGTYFPHQYINPPYEKGDILYVRETWCYGHVDCGEESDGTDVLYVSQCTDENETIPKEYCLRYDIGIDDVKWKPSIHMPKYAARIFLRVTAVRVERLQDMSIDDMINEGIDRAGIMTTSGPIRYRVIDSFEELWNSTIKKPDIDRYGWDANPWVWVIEFERVRVEDE